MNFESQNVPDRLSSSITNHINRPVILDSSITIGWLPPRKIGVFSSASYSGMNKCFFNLTAKIDCTAYCENPYFKDKKLSMGNYKPYGYYIPSAKYTNNFIKVGLNWNQRKNSLAMKHLSVMDSRTLPTISFFVPNC